MQKYVTQIAIVAAGVFVAGYVMNMLRDNEFVDNAISGFDS